MRYFRYVSPLNETMEPETVTVSTYWIERMYYPYWKERMLTVGKGELISLENCISDFCVVSWAWEVE